MTVSQRTASLPHQAMAQDTGSADASDQYASRRDFLKLAGGSIAATVSAGLVATAQAGTLAGPLQAQQANIKAQQGEIKAQQGDLAVKLAEIHGDADPKSQTKTMQPPDSRVGFAIVGLGHLSLEELLPAFGECQYARLAALVSGDHAKALKIARQYGLAESAIYNYQTYDEIANNPDVEVIYIVLPNSMHRDFTVRGAKAGKHILCEKPMATSAEDCRAMIASCKQAARKLMIAYRQQYEPMNRHVVQQIRDGKLGKLRQFVSSNAQSTGDPNQWRLNKALAGGGAMPDIGIYCLNAARFLSGHEPFEVLASTYSTPGDARFAEVEETVQFIARFPDGYTATCTSGYSSHSSKFLRINGSDGYAKMDPAYTYQGARLSYGQLVDGKSATIDPGVQEKNQFALEMDHMAYCVRNNVIPHTPGEEGLQDQIIIEAIYESARTGKAVKVPLIGNTRGPEPKTS